MFSQKHTLNSQDEATKRVGKSGEEFFLMKTSSVWHLLAALVAIVFVAAGQALASLQPARGIAEFIITINNVSQYKGEIKCTVEVRPGDGTDYYTYNPYSRSVTKDIPSATSRTVCTVRVPFNWSSVEIDYKIRPKIKVNNLNYCDCNLNDTFEYELDLNRVPYPLYGGVITINAELDI